MGTVKLRVLMCIPSQLHSAHVKSGVLCQVSDSARHPMLLALPMCACQCCLSFLVCLRTPVVDVGGCGATGWLAPQCRGGCSSDWPVHTDTGDTMDTVLQPWHRNSYEGGAGPGCRRCSKGSEALQVRLVSAGLSSS